MNKKDVQEKVANYENFIEDVLKRDLKDIEIHLNKTVQKYNEWEELQHTVKMWRLLKDRDISMLVPIGCGVNVNAVTDSYDNLLVNVGLGCMLQMNYDEVDKYSNIRMRALKKQIDHYRQLAVQVKVRIKLVLLGINELKSSI